MPKGSKKKAEPEKIAYERAWVRLYDAWIQVAVLSTTNVDGRERVRVRICAKGVMKTDTELTLDGDRVRRGQKPQPHELALPKKPLYGLNAPAVRGAAKVN